MGERIRFLTNIEEGIRTKGAVEFGTKKTEKLHPESSARFDLKLGFCEIPEIAPKDTEAAPTREEAASGRGYTETQ